jgi:putative transposase
LQPSLKDPQRGGRNDCQKRAAFPRFKKRGQNDAFRYPQGVKRDRVNNCLSLASKAGLDTLPQQP